MLGNINTLSAVGARAAYDQISGSGHNEVTQLQRRADSAFADLLNARLNQLSGNGSASYRGSSLSLAGEDFQPGEITQEGWVKRYGYAEEAGEGLNATGLKFQSQGEAYGADFNLSDHWQLGFAAGKNKLDGSDAKNNAAIESYQSALYGKYSQEDGFYFQGALGFTRQDVENKRTIDFAAIQRQANSDRTDYAALANIELGKAFEFNWGSLNNPTLVGQYNLTLTPHLGLAYSHQFLSDFEEEDAGALNLRIDRADSNSLAIVPGLAAQMKIQGEGYSLNPYIDLSYVQGLVNPVNDARASFNGARFAIEGEKEDQSYALIRTGFAMEVDEGLLGLKTDLYLDYNGKAGQNDTDHSLTSGFAIHW